jgi:hypothetical protein
MTRSRGNFHGIFSISKISASGGSEITSFDQPAVPGPDLGAVVSLREGADVPRLGGLAGPLLATAVELVLARLLLVVRGCCGGAAGEQVARYCTHGTSSLLAGPPND